MAKITGSKTTKAAEAASLRNARTRHHVGLGQLMTQPGALAVREEAKRVLEEALAAGLDGREEQEAVAFVTGAPAEATAAVAHVRPTAPYAPRVPSEMGPVAPHARLDAGQFIFIKAYRIKIGDGLISEKQAKWIVDIAERPSVTDAMRESLQARLEQGFARSAASAFITKYKDIPTAASEVAREEAINPGPGTTPAKVEVEVPAGRYALRGQDGVVRFYKLDRPTQGKWKGYTFLKVQASDDLHPIRNKAEKARIIAEIGQDTLAAEQLYGRELGKCSRCGRTLTDETSRAYGIGPDCRQK